MAPRPDAPHDDLDHLDDAGTVDDLDDAGTVDRIDHLALEVRDFDATVERLELALGVRRVRVGVLPRDPSRRIAVVRDRRGVTLELIEAPTWYRGAPTLDHLALVVSDLAAAADALVDAGSARRGATRCIHTAPAASVVVADGGGLVVQLGSYPASRAVC